MTSEFRSGFLLKIKDVLTNWMKNPVLFSGILSFLILFWFHDKGWIPFDDSVFAYVAERINEGAVYGVGVYDNHGGYQHFFNAWLFKIFGSDIVVLHYPLIIIGTLQAMMVTYSCRSKGWLVAVLAGYTVTILSYFLFKSPAPNWYALFIAFTVIWLFDRYQTSWLRNIALGALVGICLMIRHPSAIFIGFGILTYFIYETPPFQSKKNVLSKIILSIIGASLIAYLYLAFEITTFILFGIWPFFLLYFLWQRKFGDDLVLFKSLAASLIGFVAALVPIFLYQHFYGSIGTWFKSSFLSGPSIFNSELFLTVKYWQNTKSYFIGIWQNFSAEYLLFFFQNALLLIVPIIAGCIVVYYVGQNKKIPPVVFIAVFYSYVSIYVQLPPYLFFTLPLLSVVFLQGVTFNKVYKKSFVIIFFIIVSSYSLFFSDFSPLNNLNEEYTKSELPKASLFMSDEEQKTLLRILETIYEYTDISDSIFAFPNAPDIYYLSNRKNIFLFHSSMFYVNSSEEYEFIKLKIKEKVPKVVVWSKGTIVSQTESEFVQYLQSSGQYYFIESVGRYSIYLKKSVLKNDVASKCLWYGRV